MHVAIDYTAAINQSDGIGRFVRNQITALLDLDQENDYTLLYAAPNPGRELPTVCGVHVRTRALPLRERALNILWHRLRFPISITLGAGPIDLFHAPNFVLPPAGNAVSVVTVHDLAFLTHPECADARLRAYLTRAVPDAVRRADLILTDSRQTKADVASHFGIADERIQVVHGGVGSAFAPATEEEITSARQTYGLNRPYVLAVGVIEPRKNLPRLIDAFSQFQDAAGDSHDLVIVGGRGWLCDATFERAAASPVHDRIRFTGYVPDAPLTALYTGADAFAYVSLYEGFGLPVLEAMACGAPVICSDNSSLPEFATGAAVLVPPDNTDAIAVAIQSVCSDSALSATLRAEGPRRAAQYTWRVSAEQLLLAYQTAMARR